MCAVYPCESKDNIESCTCKDGKEVTGTDAMKDCGRRNFPTTCECVDETTWTKPERPTSKYTGEQGFV